MHYMIASRPLRILWMNLFMTAEERIHDIIETMVAWNLLDPKRALLDNEYLIDRVSTFLSAVKIANQMINNQH